MQHRLSYGSVMLTLLSNIILDELRRGKVQTDTWTSNGQRWVAHAGRWDLDSIHRLRDVSEQTRLYQLARLSLCEDPSPRFWSHHAKVSKTIDNQHACFLYRYIETLDSLFDSIVADMNKERFTVGDKYKPKYEELGKKTHILSHSQNTIKFVICFPNISISKASH